MLDLIYITNDPWEADVVQAAGVTHVMVDLEIRGKVDRQGHRDTVISGHAMEDISRLRPILHTSELLVRVNPAFSGSKEEIAECIDRGADRLMLPMFRTAAEVETFLRFVGGRAHTCLLLETAAAVARLPDVLEASGIDSIHLGLNDLHLDMGLTFMFELLSGGIVEYVAREVASRGVTFGFGGVARLGTGRLPAELILSEHVRLGSSQVILSRDFRRIFAEHRKEETPRRFHEETRKIQRFAKQQATEEPEVLERSRREVGRIVREIAREMALDAAGTSTSEG